MEDSGAGEQGSRRAAAQSGASEGKRSSLVRAVRMAAGLSQSELARRLGVSRTRVVALEGQGEAIHLGTLARVATACGKRVVWNIADLADDPATIARVGHD